MSRAKNLDRFKSRKDVLANSLHIASTSDVVPALVFPNRPVQPVQPVQRLKKPFRIAAQINIVWLKACMRPSHPSLKPQSGKRTQEQTLNMSELVGFGSASPVQVLRQTFSCQKSPSAWVRRGGPSYGKSPFSKLASDIF